MTACYTDAEKAAASRIGFAPILRGAVPSPSWVPDFRRIVASGFREQSRHYRQRAARVIREAEKRARVLEDRADRAGEAANDASLVARAVAREQRKAARS